MLLINTKRHICMNYNLLGQHSPNGGLSCGFIQRHLQIGVLGQTCAVVILRTLARGMG